MSEKHTGNSLSLTVAIHIYVAYDAAAAMPRGRRKMLPRPDMPGYQVSHIFYQFFDGY